MSERSNRYSLPYIMPSQAQKHVTHNEAIRLLDHLTNLLLIELDRNDPPQDPAENDCYAIGSAPTGDWTHNGDKIAAFVDGAWMYTQPFSGLRAYVQSAEKMMQFDGSSWIAISGDVENVDRLGINTTPEDTNKLAVKSDAVLFSHDDVTPGSGDSLVTVNRDSQNKNAKLQFTTSYSTGAEFGLSGDDSFRLKVSADGSTFKTAIAVEPTEGTVGIGAEPGSEELRVRKDKDGSTQFTVSNYSSNSSASAAFRLNAAGGFYLNNQLYGSGTAYLYSNANMVFGTYADKYLALRTNTTNRMTIHGDGRVTIATFAPSAQFAVDGAVRVGSADKANLPSPSTNGSGAIIFVPDASPGATMAYSDGSEWRRFDDNSIIV